MVGFSDRDRNYLKGKVYFHTVTETDLPELLKTNVESISGRVIAHSTTFRNKSYFLSFILIHGLLCFDLQ